LSIISIITTSVVIWSFENGFLQKGDIKFISVFYIDWLHLQSHQNHIERMSISILAFRSKAGIAFKSVPTDPLPEIH
jgi:hypothetical protein